MNEIGQYLEDIIEKCGGFGKFQFFLIVILYASKISVTWTMMMMSFAGAEPDWWCSTEDYVTTNTTFTMPMKTCTYLNSSTCTSFRYDDKMNTVLSEFDLLCDKKSITSTITTIQMAGVLVGGLVIGQMADVFGRKPSLFIAVFIIAVSNLLAYFSVNWEMFAALRFVMGISCGMILTVYIVWMYEFLSSTKRAVFAGLPTWTLFAALFALVCWLFPDWKNVHLACTIVAAPILLSWWIMPESFRWLVSHRRFDDARDVVKKMARINGREVPDLSNLEKIAMKEAGLHKDRTYTILDLFKDSYLRKNTLLLAFMWITCGYVYYAISFNVQKLSGDIFLNMFLLSMVEIPANALTICLNNKFGRKKTAIGFFIVCGIGAIGVALSDVLDIDPDLEGKLINAFALTSKLGIAAAWVSLAVISTEVYPTVVRNIGYGFQNTVARIGAMVAPKMIFLNDSYPGLLYFLSAAMVTLSCVCAYFASETNNLSLQETMHSEIAVDKKYTTEKEQNDLTINPDVEVGKKVMTEKEQKELELSKL